MWVCNVGVHTIWLMQPSPANDLACKGCIVARHLIDVVAGNIERVAIDELRFEERPQVLDVNNRGEYEIARLDGYARSKVRVSRRSFDVDSAAG